MSTPQHHSLHNLTLSPPFTRTNYFTYLYVPYTITLWNNPDYATVNAPSVQSFNTLPAGNNFGWIRPQCGIIESRVTVCRVFNSRLLYVVRACNLLVNFCENKRELAYIPVALPLNTKLRNPQCMK